MARIEAGAFLEHVKYVSGKRYGTLRSEMQRVADDGRVCVLELELDGALAVQEEVPGQRHALHRRSRRGARAPAPRPGNGIDG